MKFLLVCSVLIVAFVATEGDRGGRGGRGGRGRDHGRGIRKIIRTLCDGLTNPDTEQQIQSCLVADPPLDSNVTAKIQRILEHRNATCDRRQAGGPQRPPFDPHKHSHSSSSSEDNDRRRPKPEEIEKFRTEKRDFKRFFKCIEGIQQLTTTAAPQPPTAPPTPIP